MLAGFRHSARNLVGSFSCRVGGFGTPTTTSWLSHLGESLCGNGSWKLSGSKTGVDSWPTPVMITWPRKSTPVLNTRFEGHGLRSLGQNTGVVTGSRMGKPCDSEGGNIGSPRSQQWLKCDWILMRRLWRELRCPTCGPGTPVLTS